MKNKTVLSLAALSILSMANVASAAHGSQRCAPEKGAPCNADDCCRTYCLGPENYGANAPVNPVTCNGDFSVSLAGFYWNAHQDGMEYALDTQVRNPNVADVTNGANVVTGIETLNQLISAKYETPHFEWDFGFKVGLAYNSPSDGWDFGVNWTWYRGKANDEVEAEIDDNHSLLPLWSAFAPTQGLTLYATDIETHWSLKLNLIDIELGRQFWTSRLLSIRPHIGLRIAFIDQAFEIDHKGGSYGARVTATSPDAAAQIAMHNQVDLDNKFHGVGVRGGLDSEWNFGCGWALYANFAAAIVYGRFHVKHDETNREAQVPHPKHKVLEAEDSFRASRGTLDLALGIQYSALFYDSAYGLTVQLGWEQHMFFDQNQLWRAVRIGDTGIGPAVVSNDTGENVYHQRRGDLDTQGFTLRFKLEF